MNCIIDRGNTKTKIYFFDGDEMKEEYSFFNEAKARILARIESQAFEYGVLSSSSNAVPGLDMSNFIELDYKTKIPIKLNYKTPETLGSDRIALAVGAEFLYPKRNVLIISAGTCITLDVIDDKGVFQGGIITPGMTIRLQSLHTFTQNLPLLDYKAASDYPLIGKSTKESMESGIYNGAIAEVVETISRFKAIYQDLTVILTGGDLNLFEFQLKNEIFAQPNLQAIGLNRILLHNAM